MKVEIDRDGCIGCGLCASTCPEVFTMSDDGKADAIDNEVPVEYQDSANDAANGCPVSVIEVN